MEKIYDLKVGDCIEIAGFSEDFQGKYQVKQVIENVAVCVSECSGKLILPLTVPMPFAVLIKGEEQAKPVQFAEKQVVAEVKEAAPAEKPAPKNQVKHVEVSEPKVQISTERKVGVIEFYDALKHWGKLSHDRFKKGIFFFIDEVKDPELKQQLEVLLPGEPWTERKISYLETPNPRHMRMVWASDIQFADEDAVAIPAKPVEVPSVPKTGYVTEYGVNGGKIMVGDVGNQFSFSIDNVEDAALAEYLENEVPSGLVDYLNIQVRFVANHKRAEKIEWIREKTEE